MALIARRLRLSPGHRFPRHAHQGWSFGLLRGGSVRLRRDGVWSQATPASATVLHPGELHDGVVDEDRALSYVAVTVPEDVVADLLGGGRSPSFTDIIQPSEPVRRLVNSTHSGAPEEQREQTVAALCSVFAHSRVVTTGEPGTRSARRLATAVKLRLDACFTEPVRILDIAGHLGVTPAALIRAFRRSHGLSPYAYVVSRRVDLARQLLDAGVQPIEVAGRAGFYDQPHLNRHFTRMVGVPPGAYQRG
ncbi:helix-turn-helix transcriptional regulator [Virgisporangium aurantiacum]|uniref:AraC family transcriptional regulator n=1 Tax=Virgisporangium aurantiacum TaxID=175570 RepID=A0A8J4E0A0_9ACTN|nr:AraC family transcriptional regulator [Virgisporangium aurantiacum]GIJ56473.1 AraC family transcriptional regulator [Virgisporangium aurantiacum]